MRNGNHVRDRLRQLEAKVSALEMVAADVAHLRRFAEHTKWLARTAMWLGCSVAAHGATGGLASFLQGLAKLLGRGLA
jgi:hypothetical protein